MGANEKKKQIIKKKQQRIPMYWWNKVPPKTKHRERDVLASHLRAAHSSVSYLLNIMRAQHNYNPATNQKHIIALP